MLHQADDNELVRLFKEHIDREKAFTVIVKRYQEKVYWQIRRLVVSHDDADDVMQHVFIKAWKGLDNFREDAKLYTWLYRIAVNESLSFLEQQKGFDEKEAVWKLQKAIQQLPEKQRAVFNLRYFEEMPYEQMSEVLETSVGALKASYHHAVKKIEDYILHH
jgi:DNA-directed RNA polymerase specialized sigma24 family protein